MQREELRVPLLEPEELAQRRYLDLIEIFFSQVWPCMVANLTAKLGEQLFLYILSPPIKAETKQRVQQKEEESVTLLSRPRLFFGTMA